MDGEDSGVSVWMVRIVSVWMVRIVGFQCGCRGLWSFSVDGEDSGVSVWMVRIVGFQCGWRG